MYTWTNIVNKLIFISYLWVIVSGKKGNIIKEVNFEDNT